MSRTRIHLAALAVASVLVVPLPGVQGAQHAASLSGAVLGYLWSAEDAQLRPVRGVPGSATIGDPIDIGFPVQHVLALTGRHLIVSRASAPSLLLVDMAQPEARAVPLMHEPIAPARAAASGRGTAAALWDAEASRMVVLAGLPDAPRVLFHTALPHPELPVTRMAVTDDGSLLVYAAAHGASTWLFGVTSDGAVRFLADVEIGAMAFAGDALVLAGGGDILWRVRDVRGAARLERFAGPAQGVSAPVALGSPDGERIHVANAGSRTVLTLDSSGRVVGRLRCDCEIAGLLPVQPGLFFLTDRIDRTPYLFDARHTAARIVFVPAVRGAAPEAP